MRLFWLHRKVDVSGVSGVGIVAEGVVFSDGHYALRWLGALSTTEFGDRLEDCAAIHGHNGATELVYDGVVQ